MRSKKYMTWILMLALMTFLAACSIDTNDEKLEDQDKEERSDSGNVPANLKKAKHSKYRMGYKATIEADHRKGMKGAEATIVGVYETKAYVVSYTPTTDGDKVEKHKWVIHEEIQNAGGEKLKQGERVVLAANHRKGMEGAIAEIKSSEETTVYMIDYSPKTGKKRVNNYKWVIEDELSKR